MFYFGYELIPNRFEQMMQELNQWNEDGYSYMAGIPREKWTNAYDGGYRYDHMTTNLAETINSALKGIHNLLVTAIIKSTYFHLGKLFTNLGKEAYNLEAARQLFHPMTQKEINDVVHKSRGLYVLSMSRLDTIFHVSNIPRPL